MRDLREAASLVLDQYISQSIQEEEGKEGRLYGGWAAAIKRGGWANAEARHHEFAESQPVQPAGPRPVHQIAREIKNSWKNVHYAAKPYLEAMHSLESGNDNYGADPGHHVIAYFLSNATGWRGPDAKRIKAELKAHISAATGRRR